MSFRLPACSSLLLALVSFWIAAASVTSSVCTADDAGVEFYEKKVRPVLAAHCYECHGPDKQEAGLQVDSVAAMLRGGDQGAAIVPGSPDESLLVEGIKYDNLDFQMPPKGKMADAEVAAIVDWIKQGAPAPKDEAKTASAGPKKVFDLAERKKHWCFQPLNFTNPPNVRDEAWLQGDIDRFILAKLEAARIKPAAEADPRTLIRRLYFDLIGLPPTPAEVEDFVKHFPSSREKDGETEGRRYRRKEEQAYEALVDKLLASPHFGERWGRHWLDLVRYAETRGHEFDYLIPNAYRYRDYVVRAFNDNVPYDRFVVEHLAGDLMPNPRQDAESANLSILGTGFWFLGEECHSPVDIRQDETDRVDNKIDVMSKTFLGLTLACARCHDHKFDAISTKDYYALSGYVLGMSYRQTAFESDLWNRRAYEFVQGADEQYEPLLRKTQHQQLRPVLEQADRYLAAVRAAWVPGVSDQAKLRRQAAIAEAARRFEVDPKRLEAWVDYFLSPAAKVGPLSAWREFIETNRLPERWTSPPAGSSKAPGVAASGAPRVIVDFAAPEVWLADGLAWGVGPRRLGSVAIGDDPQHPLRRVATTDAAAVDLQWDMPVDGQLPNEREDGRLNWRQTGRTIKTPTFTLETGKLRYRIRGSVKVYAAVASHRVNKGPLHGKLAATFAGGDEWRWVDHDLSEYTGRRVHLEFSPFERDELKGNQSRESSVRGVVESLPPTNPPAPASAIPWDFGDTERYAADELRQRKSLQLEHLGRLKGEELAGALASGMKRLLVDGARNVLVANDEPVRPAAAAAVDFMLSHREMWSTATEPDRDVVHFFTERNGLLAKLRSPSQTAPAAWEGTAVDEHVLIRGNHRTEGDMVPRRFLEAFDGPAVASKEPGRLELAERIVNGRDPLPARVIVNRLWQHLFGRGIVRTVDNFGIMGEQPTHPELLDYLAREFMADAWSMKRAIRRMVLSSAYRMGSAHGSDSKADEADPQNNLFHRANVKRLEGEIVRDALLAVSGRLDRKLGGPSVEVYLTPFMEGRGRPSSGPLDGAGRRSIYLRVRRNFLNPMFQAFDYPTPFTSVGRRSASNVPAQALALMNGPLVVDLAKQWSVRILKETQEEFDEMNRLLQGSRAKPGEREIAEKQVRESRSSHRIDRLYREAFSRRPTADEAAAAREFVAEQAKLYGAAEDDVRVWADLCHVLFNAKEFIYIQ
jgi:mono/diheme cytochrome c family protein